MSTEHIHFAGMEVTRVIGSWLGSTYFAFGVFGFRATFLVGRFFPVELRQLEDVDVVEAEVAGVVAAEDEEFVLADGTGSVVGSSQRSLSLASLSSPLHTVGCHFDRVHFIVWTKFAIFTMALVQPTEHHVHFTHCCYCMTRSTRRLVSSLFQCLIISWFRHI